MIDPDELEALPATQKDLDGRIIILKAQLDEIEAKIADPERQKKTTAAKWLAWRSDLVSIRRALIEELEEVRKQSRRLQEGTSAAKAEERQRRDALRAQKLVEWRENAKGPEIQVIILLWELLHQLRRQIREHDLRYDFDEEQSESYRIARQFLREQGYLE
jgi:hypothetical protein